MAANNKKRVAVKHIRDGIKSRYKKDCKCSICGTDENLELHHYTTVSTLFKNYVEEHNIPVTTDEEVVAMRDGFYAMYEYELIDFTVTLCADHHRKLHSIYGREPPLHTAEKQERWVKKQRDKAEGKVSKGRFSSLI